jgi:DNA polymerase III subunit epsilon
VTPDTPIRQVRFAGIDFESAGAARGRTDVPVQIGLADWSVTEGHRDAFVSYLSSTSPITWSAKKVHGIRDEDLIGAPSLLELWPVVKKHLGSAVVVAHGKGTEKRFLRTFPGHGFGPWVDTLLLARAAWPEQPDHSLSTLCLSRNLDPRIRELAPKGSWHDALFDTIASLALLENIIETFELADRPLAQLVFPDTREWHQQRSR